MGSGLCTRRQKSLWQMGLCLVALACLVSGGFLYNHCQQKIKLAKDLALKYKQQQEALSAQLQVVYEHRSRLERSLQKERGEHKKTKEDFLVYKLEAQEALNKEKQDSMNRYGALSSQHKILKNQHDEVKKQLIDLQLQHNGLKLEHRKIVETHNQKYAQLQREKESEVSALQDTVYKLREESKLLRKAHQDIHSQLLNAHVQMEEFRQLKETLQKMPSFKEMAGMRGQQKPPAKEKPPTPALAPLPTPKPKVSVANAAKASLSPLEKTGNSLFAPASDTKRQGGENLPDGQVSYRNDGPKPQGSMPLGQVAPPNDVHLPPAGWAAAGQRDNPIIRFTRMVNSVQNGNTDHKSTKAENEDNVHPDHRISPALEAAQTMGKQPSVGSEWDPDVQSWQDTVKKVNAQMDEKQAPPYPQSIHEPVVTNGKPKMASQHESAERLPISSWTDGKGGMDNEELQMDAGIIAREEDSRSYKEVPDRAADPAQDPNNQGEDEFEEAELERPDFDEKANQADNNGLGPTNGAAKDSTKEKIPKVDAAGPKKISNDLMDDYQEDEEEDLEDRRGEADDADDLELVPEQKERIGGGKRKDNYY
ncbi:Golgi integral membrane protein 4-like isoform X2 [Anolis sagrei]|uniref:Golgi integral membrane protein 4-like isoform X2 n=1 Tax=Anolis sagrei TaxID=38937 RepID=UPI003520624A